MEDVSLRIYAGDLQKHVGCVTGYPLEGQNHLHDHRPFSLIEHVRSEDDPLTVKVGENGDQRVQVQGRNIQQHIGVSTEESADLAQSLRGFATTASVDTRVTDDYRRSTD